MEGTTLRLLIVDDDDAVRDVLKLRLENRADDILLSEAASPEEALNKISEEVFDLVLLDLRLKSGTEGLDVLTEIKKIQPQIEVIMLSAYGTTPAIVEAMKRGAIDFVTKDTDYEDLVVLKLDRFIREAVLLADRERNINGLYETVLIEDINRKGKALETLVASLFSSVKGLVEVERNINTATEEIDIVFSNESIHPRWQKESGLILVECKNWLSKRVGKNELVVFKAKLENRVGRCRLGFLVCVEQFADTVTKEMLRGSKDDVLVVPIDGEKLKRLVRSEDRNQLLIDYITEASLI